MPYKAGDGESQMSNNTIFRMPEHTDIVKRGDLFVDTKDNAVAIVCAERDSDGIFVVWLSNGTRSVWYPDGVSLLRTFKPPQYRHFRNATISVTAEHELTVQK